MEELLSVQPNELKFPFELKKQISCLLKLVNNTDKYVAFKVKTTSPKKYCVRPNTGAVSPHGSAEVTVTMQAQREAPPDMQCKDKFLVQSVLGPEGLAAKDVTQEMFSKDSGSQIFETKLKVLYVSPPVAESMDDSYSNGEVRSFQDEVKSSDLKAKLAEVKSKLTNLTEERNSAVQLSQSLQQELGKLTQERKKDSLSTKQHHQVGVSFVFVFLAGVVGILLGYLLRT